MASPGVLQGPLNTDQPRPQLAVERHLEVVTLTITCSSQYAAMELYDEVCRDARDGFVMLERE